MALDPTIPLGVKPIDFLGSAGNLLNLARGAQALQQEQTLNPIQAEKAAIELGIARDTQQAEIARQKALSTQAQTGAEKGQFELSTSYEERMRRVLAGLPQTRSFQNLLQDPSAALMDVRDAEDRLIASGIPKKTAVLLTSSLTSQIADAKRTGDMTPVNNWFYNNIIGSQTAAQQQVSLAPPGAPQVSFGGVPGSVISTPEGAQFVPTMVEPRPRQPATPPEGAMIGAYVKPKFVEKPPETGPADKRGSGVSLAQPEAVAPAQPQGVTATQMSLRYPVRQPGQAFLPVQGEEADRATGQKYVGDLVAMQPAMTSALRSIEEVIDKANKIQQQSYFQAGAAGSMERNVRGFFGSEDYKQLSKDLANVQIGMIQSKGGSLDTVSGQALARHANGDETYPPNVLKSIAQRSYADLLATKLEGRAAANFAQNFGDANHNTFKQLWSKNADSRIFEIMALPKLIPDKAERIKAANEILKNATQKEREEFNRKYQNILRLEQTGSL